MDSIKQFKITIMNKYIGESVDQKYMRRFRTPADKKLWDRIYETLTAFGGFSNQAEATDSLFALHHRVIIKDKL